MEKKIKTKRCWLFREKASAKTTVTPVQAASSASQGVAPTGEIDGVMTILEEMDIETVDVLEEEERQH